jgi:hypothetical protein
LSAQLLVTARAPYGSLKGMRTLYFHMCACQHYRNNHIVSLSNNGSIAVNHNEKEDMLYDFYNGLIGTGLVVNMTLI